MSKLSSPSATILNIGSFVIILIWAYIGLMASEYLLVDFFQRIEIWMLTSFLLELSMLIAILSVCWWVKSKWLMIDIQWEYSIREIELQELEAIYNEYLGAYPWFINHYYFKRILLMIFVFLITPLVPFLTHPFGIYAFSYSPVFFALFLIGLGIISVRAIYPALPSPAGDGFSLPPLSKVKSAIRVLKNIDSVSWTGVKVNIGQFDGYYTIADAQPVGRIRGFESVLRVEFSEDVEGHYKSIRVVDLSGAPEDQEGKLLFESNSASLDSIRRAIKKSIASFSKSHGYDDDTMEFFQELHTSSEDNE
ncbi:hypothetical protein EU537_11275 [Candidatus Thorarchaeota archaeon]|nr:MAG: hypothetical protein EU537_11275 [Candidatus Thorarchaeota archaeon]